MRPIWFRRPRDWLSLLPTNTSFFMLTNTVIPAPIRLASLLAFALGSLALPTSLPADSPVAPISPDKRANRLEDKRFERRTLEPRRNQRFQGQRFDITEWDKRFSSLGTRRAPGVQPRKQTQNARERAQFRIPKIREIEIREKKITGLIGEDARLADPAEAQEPSLAERFQGTPVVVMDLQAAAFREKTKDLSLQDINRYQFRRNRSSEPGLPVTEAGTEKGRGSSSTADRPRVPQTAEAGED
jgi:hypothetical protein